MLEGIKATWPGMKESIPSDEIIEKLIEKFSSLKRFGDNKILDVADEIGTHAGIAFHVANYIKESRKIYVAPSSEQSRIDRILHIKDSSGRSRARKF